MEKIFKSIVLISTLLTVLFWVLPLYNYANFTEEEFNILSWSGYGSIIPSTDFIYWSLLVVWLVVNFGLYFYVKPFKTIFTIVIIITGIANAFWGISILPPVEHVLFSLLSTLDGAILAMLYLTSISTKFNPALASGSSGTSKQMGA